MSEGNAQWCSIAAKGDDVNDHDYIRKHILEYKGVPENDPPGKVCVEFYERAIRSKWGKFYDLCCNRILMGRFRYGPFDNNRPYDCAKDLQRRLDRYKETRNAELLVDLANYAWIEYEYGTHPDKHFTPIDDGEHGDGQGGKP